eukprot:CAMPEP_0197243064 /NCGR_PEP_ID=MMETSP1429-20130617/8625_1 /TAXON_ID=49237 /ORGANISM="Chaetoceros  sp., Strain UNC1202" /LENGTH=285 /DNA_ID=CAMNT_0042703203 /DNA_START=41 /DNA_END=898 /DNA_ORIENTATION=+
MAFLNFQIPSLLAFIALIWANVQLASATSTLTVSVTSCSGDLDVFTVSRVGIACDDSCTWGADAYLTGAFTISDSLSTNSPLTTTKIWGIQVDEQNADLCGSGTSTTGAGYYCPSIGTYSFGTDITLPGNTNGWYNSLTKYVSIKVTSTFDFGSSQVQCIFSIKGQKVSSDDDNGDGSYSGGGEADYTGGDGYSGGGDNTDGESYADAASPYTEYSVDGKTSVSNGSVVRNFSIFAAFVAAVVAAFAVGAVLRRLQLASQNAVFSDEEPTANFEMMEKDSKADVV